MKRFCVTEPIISVCGATLIIEILQKLRLKVSRQSNVNFLNLINSLASLYRESILYLFKCSAVVYTRP